MTIPVFILAPYLHQARWMFKKYQDWSFWFFIYKSKSRIKTSTQPSNTYNDITIFRRLEFSLDVDALSKR